MLGFFLWVSSGRNLKRQSLKRLCLFLGGLLIMRLLIGALSFTEKFFWILYKGCRPKKMHRHLRSQDAKNLFWPMYWLIYLPLFILVKKILNSLYVQICQGSFLFDRKKFQPFNCFTLQPEWDLFFIHSSPQMVALYYTYKIYLYIASKIVSFICNF